MRGVIVDFNTKMEIKKKDCLTETEIEKKIEELREERRSIMDILEKLEIMMNLQSRYPRQHNNYIKNKMRSRELVREMVNDSKKLVTLKERQNNIKNEYFSTETAKIYLFQQQINLL